MHDVAIIFHIKNKAVSEYALLAGVFLMNSRELRPTAALVNISSMPLPNALVLQANTNTQQISLLLLPKPESDV